MGRLIIQKPGLFTSIQDEGRYGFRRYGVPVSGAMDQQSAGLANLLVNNGPEEGVMEITMHGPEIQLEADGLLAITGADLSPGLDGHPIPMNTPVFFEKGQRLTCGRPRYGIRAYLAVHGGLKSPKVLASRSQYYPVTATKRLHMGDTIALKNYKNATKPHASVKVDTTHFSTEQLEVYVGPELTLLSKKEQSLLFEERFTIGTNNRMGYQLQPDADLSNNLSIITAPVIPGTVQLTPSGKLIVLMRDGQVTGGYPRVAQLSRESINRLAQKTNGETIEFSLLKS